MSKKLLDDKLFEKATKSLQSMERSGHTVLEFLKKNEATIYKLNKEDGFKIIDIAKNIVETGVPVSENTLRPLVSKIIKDYKASMTKGNASEKGKSPDVKKPKTTKTSKNSDDETSEATKKNKSLDGEKSETKTMDKFKDKTYEKKEAGFNESVEYKEKI